MARSLARRELHFLAAPHLPRHVNDNAPAHGRLVIFAYSATPSVAFSPFFSRTFCAPDFRKCRGG